MTEFTAQVILVIQQIPYGKVMSYGQIAKSAGNPWGARQVVRILNSESRKINLPWHRVINSEGKISLTGEDGLLQRSRLEKEGIIFKNDRIDLSRFQYFLAQSS